MVRSVCVKGLLHRKQSVLYSNCCFSWNKSPNCIPILTSKNVYNLYEFFSLWWTLACTKENIELITLEQAHKYTVFVAPVYSKIVQQNDDYCYLYETLNTIIGFFLLYKQQRHHKSIHMVGFLLSMPQLVWCEYSSDMEGCCCI